MPRKASIPALRRHIDRIDDRILRLLNERAAVAVAIAEQKARTNSSVYAPGRERGVLGRVARTNRGPLPEQSVRAIFREIISASRSLELPHARTEQEASNAAAAERAGKESGTAAIAAEAAAETYGLAVIAQAIQDEPGNLTRFLVLGQHDAEQPSGDDKTSLVMSVRDEVGILARMLRPFAAHGIDLIKIESRPLRERPWEYFFFLDLKGHRRERRRAQAAAAVGRGVLRRHVLRRLPPAPPGGRWLR